MTNQLLIRAQMTVSGTPGTGVITLGSATSAYQSFAAAGLTNGETISYLALDGVNWEVGTGTYSTIGLTLTRTTITDTSAGGTSPISLSSGAIVTSTIQPSDVAGGSSGIATQNNGTAVGSNQTTLNFVNATSVTTSGSTTTVTVPTGGSSGPAYAGVTAETASYTLQLTDAGNVVTINDASANNLTVPLNASVAFPVGTVIQVQQLGAGVTTIVATGGVTLQSLGGTLALSGQYGTATLIKVGTNTWIVAIIPAASGGGSPYIGGTPPTIVQVGSSQSTSGGDSVTMGSAPTNGNLLIAVMVDTGSNPTAGSGWTQVALQTSGSLDVGIYKKTAGASESTTQTPIAGSTANNAIVIWEISGVATGIVFYAASAGAQSPAIPVTTSSLGLTFIGTNNTTSGIITNMYGMPSMTNLTGSGAQAAYGSGSSANAQSYGLACLFSTGLVSDYAVVVVE